MSGLNYLGKTDTDNSLATKSLFDSRVNGYLTQEELSDAVAQRLLHKALIEYVTLQDNKSVRRSYFDEILSRKIAKAVVGHKGGIAPLQEGKIPMRFLKEGPRMPYTWGTDSIVFSPAQVGATGPVQLTSFVLRDPGYLYFPFFFGAFSIVGLASDTSQGVGGGVLPRLLADALEGLISHATGGALGIDLDVILSTNILPGYLNVTIRTESSVGSVVAGGITDIYNTYYDGVRSGTIIPAIGTANGLTPYGFDRDLSMSLVAHAPSQGSNMLLTTGQASCLLFPVFAG